MCPVASSTILHDFVGELMHQVGIPVAIGLAYMVVIRRIQRLSWAFARRPVPAAAFSARSRALINAVVAGARISTSPGSSASVRSRMFSSTTECWKVVYGSYYRSRRTRYARSGALIRASLWLSRRSRATSANSSVRSRSSTSGNGDAGEGLVDMHAIELFSVGVEPHHPMVTQKAADLFGLSLLFQLQAPQKQSQPMVSNKSPDAIQERRAGFQGSARIRPRLHHGEHDTFSTARSRNSGSGRHACWIART